MPNETRAEQTARIADETEHFVAFAKEHPGIELQTLAEMLGVTRNVLQKRFRRIGYIHTPREYWHKRRAEKIRELVAQHPDWKQSQIAEALGCDIHTISDAIREFRIPYENKNGKRSRVDDDEQPKELGEDNAKLNRDAAAANAAGMSYGQWRASLQEQKKEKTK